MDWQPNDHAYDSFRDDEVSKILRHSSIRLAMIDIKRAGYFLIVIADRQTDADRAEIHAQEPTRAGQGVCISRQFRHERFPQTRLIIQLELQPNHVADKLVVRPARGKRLQIGPVSDQVLADQFEVLLDLPFYTNVPFVDIG